MTALTASVALAVMPRPLKEGDKIAIVSPAGIVSPQNVRQAAQTLRDLGFDTYVSPHAFGRHGEYAGTKEERLEDLRNALTDTTVRAVLCSRGGYGCVHLLSELEKLDLRKDPKWIIGFSDISALHALTHSQGVASIHGSMTSHIAKYGPDDLDFLALLDILDGHEVTHTFDADSHNVEGSATGTLVGGNLSVIADLIGTPMDVFQPGSILVIEDVSEPVYKIERIIYQLLLSGKLQKLAGIVVGKFTKYTPSGGETVEQMLRPLLADLGIPVAYNAPVGHVSHNIPLVLNAPARLEVKPEGVTLVTGIR